MKLKSLFLLSVMTVTFLFSCQKDSEHLGKKKFAEIEVWSQSIETETTNSLNHILIPAIDENDNIYLFGTNNLSTSADNVYSFTKDGTQRWKIATTGSLRSHIIYYNDKILFVTKSYNEVSEYLRCLDANSGQELWHFSFHSSGDIYSTPIALNNSGIFVAGYDTIHKVDFNGNKIYSIYTAARRSLSINCVNNTVYVASSASSNNEVTELFKISDNEATASIDWQLEIVESCNSGDLAIDDEQNIYLFTGSYLYCITPDGSIKWKLGNELAVNNTLDMLSTSITDSGYVIAGNLDLFKINQKGNIVWKHEHTDIPDFDILLSPAIGSNGKYYYVEGYGRGSNDGMRVFNPDDGSYFWYSYNPKGAANQAIMHNGNIVFEREGTVYCIKTESGGLSESAQYPKIYYDYGNTAYKKIQ